MQNLSNISVAILAGGLGTRLRSVVADKPKVLAKVQGRPFLEYLLDQLVGVGVRDVVLCTGYLGEEIQKQFGVSYKCLSLEYSQELSPQGTAGALRLAKPFLISDPVLVMNGDSFCQVNLQTFYSWYHEHQADSALVLTRVSNIQRYGSVRCDVNGCVLSFDEKGKKTGPGWINAGIYLLSQRLLSEIPESGVVSLEREIFPRWVGRELYGYPNKGKFLDIGTPTAYAFAKQFFDSEENVYK